MGNTIQWAIQYSGQYNTMGNTIQLATRLICSIDHELIIRRSVTKLIKLSTRSNNVIQYNSIYYDKGNTQQQHSINSNVPYC